MDRQLTSRTLRRCVVGRDVAIIEEGLGEVYIESRMRLRPGSYIELCNGDTRPALVATWMIARLGKGGPVYRGVCRWETPHG